MAEAYFGLRRTRKRTHPVRCPCCNSEEEPDHHANDEEEASSNDSNSTRPKRSKRNIAKKEKELNENNRSENRKCVLRGADENVRSSAASGSRGVSRQSSPDKEKQAQNSKEKGKTSKSLASDKNSKAKTSRQNSEEKDVEKEVKIVDKVRLSSKKVKKKETISKTSKNAKDHSRKPVSDKKNREKQNVGITKTKDISSLSQVSDVKETNKLSKSKKTQPSKKSSLGTDKNGAINDSTGKQTTTEKRIGSEQVPSGNSGKTTSGDKAAQKKLATSKPLKECVDFDDSDELPLSVTKASISPSKKTSNKVAKDSKKDSASIYPTPRDFGTRKIRMSYCNFDEVSRSKLEVFDHLFQELKKCPGYSKLTIAGAVDMLTEIDKEQLKLIIKPKQSKAMKSKSSPSDKVTAKVIEETSSSAKKKRLSSSNAEENHDATRKVSTPTPPKAKARRSSSSSKQKTHTSHKGQEMNECQAAEALLNFKSKPAVTRSEKISREDSDMSVKEEEVTEKEMKELPVSTVSLTTESKDIGSVSSSTIQSDMSSNLAAKTLLQIQTTVAHIPTPNTPVTETAQTQVQNLQPIASAQEAVTSQTTFSSVSEPTEKICNEGVREVRQPAKVDKNTVALSEQVAKAMDSLAHIFEQNQRHFPGFPVQATLPQNVNFNPVTWAQTVPGSLSQFSSIPTSLPSNLCQLTPQAIGQLTSQAFTQMASHVFSQVPQAKQQLLASPVTGVVPGTPTTLPTFLPTPAQMGLSLQQAGHTTAIPTTETQSTQAIQPKAAQLPLKSMEEIVGNVGQTGASQPAAWNFAKSQSPVVYLAGPQTLGGVPRTIVPSTQCSTGAHLGQENLYKPITAKITPAKPELAPAPAVSRIAQGTILPQGQAVPSAVGKRPILPREQSSGGTSLSDLSQATHRLPAIVPQVPGTCTVHASSTSLGPAQQGGAAGTSAGAQLKTVTSTTVSAKQAVKNLVRERTKSAELKRQDSSGCTNSRTAANTEPAEQGLTSAVGRGSPHLIPLQPRRISESASDNSGTSFTSTIDFRAIQQAPSKPNEFNVEQAASALLSIGVTESPEGKTASQGDDPQEGHEEKVVFTSKGMFRVGDVEVDPEYNRIGREGYTCGKCSKIFTSLSYLARHIKRVCPDMSCRKWKCNQCDKAFRHPFGLQQHVYTHTGERPHQCVQCPKAFYSSNDLRRHSRIHSGERPYKCKHCEKSFATTISLKTHTYIHTGEKPHKCPHCPKTFATSSKLGRHIVTHSEQRPFSCQQCPKSFNRSGDLRRHSLHVHESHDKPFECDECNKPFATSVCLKIHKNVHKDSQSSNENEKPFKCSMCDKTYDSSVQLEKHHLSHIPSATSGYNYKQFHPIAPKPSAKLDDVGGIEGTDVKTMSSGAS